MGRNLLTFSIRFPSASLHGVGGGGDERHLRIVPP